MEINEETIQAQIPYYLTQDAKKNLVDALNDFPAVNYYTSLYPSDILQGDGWTQLEIIRFEDGKRDWIKGIILSNSCDISPDNKRILPSKITFAPIIKLQNFKILFEGKGFPEDQIESRIKAICDQRVSTMFYLPKGAGLESDHVAILDDLHTIPFALFEANVSRDNVFTLSQVGFYIFLFKLSVHFCRFQENIARQ